MLSVAPAHVEQVLAGAARPACPCAIIGVAGGDRLVAEGAFDVALADATTAWRDAIPVPLGWHPWRRASRVPVSATCRRILVR